MPTNTGLMSAGIGDLEISFVVNQIRCQSGRSMTKALIRFLKSDNIGLKPSNNSRHAMRISASI